MHTHNLLNSLKPYLAISKRLELIIEGLGAITVIEKKNSFFLREGIRSVPDSCDPANLESGQLERESRDILTVSL